MNADDPLFGAFKEIAAKHGLSLAAAQDIVDMVAPKLTDALTAPYQLWKKTQENWQAEAKADSEFGGPDFARNMASIAKVLDQHCDPKLRDALNVTGAGNHPAIIRSFWRIAQILTEPKRDVADMRPHVEDWRRTKQRGIGLLAMAGFGGGMLGQGVSTLLKKLGLTA